MVGNNFHGIDYSGSSSGGNLNRAIYNPYSNDFNHQQAYYEYLRGMSNQQQQQPQELPAYKTLHLKFPLDFLPEGSSYPRTEVEQLKDRIDRTRIRLQ